MNKQKKRPSNDSIISEVRKAIYTSLEHYWHDPDHIGLIATLLDPRLKSMKLWSNETRNKNH